MPDNVDVEQMEAGCYIDGHWGQYGIARVIILASEMGWTDNDAEAEQAVELAEKHLASMGPSDSPDLTGDEWEQLMYDADKAEEWLNDNKAMDGYSFGWEDGEFFYMHSSWWNDEDEDYERENAEDEDHETPLDRRHVVMCEQCDGPISSSDWLDKANSDASWHNTMTGHDVSVASKEEE